MALSPEQDAAAQQSRIADDGVQRSAQLVRQYGKEFVLHPVRRLRLFVKAGVCQRDRRPRRNPNRKSLVLLGEGAYLGVAEK